MSRGSVDLHDANGAKTASKVPLDSAISKHSNFLTRTNTASTNKLDFLKSLTQRQKHSAVSTRARNSPTKQPHPAAPDDSRHLRESETIKIRGVEALTCREKQVLCRDARLDKKYAPFDVDQLKGDLKWAAKSVSNFQLLARDPKFAGSRSPRAPRKSRGCEEAAGLAPVEQQKALTLIKLKKKFQEEVTEIYMRLIRDKKKVYVKIAEGPRD